MDPHLLGGRRDNDVHRETVLRNPPLHGQIIACDFIDRGPCGAENDLSRGDNRFS